MVSLTPSEVQHCSSADYCIWQSYCICIVSSVTLYFVLKSANKDKGTLPEDETERAKLAFQDLTDKENPYFRYVY
jgi:hypothetical protein